MASTITLLCMDAPYESANSTTALRLVEAAIRRGLNVNVFAYEGAVAYSIATQKPHQNPVKGTSVEEERHPTTKDWVAALLREAEEKGLKLDWVRCGLCEDERGAFEQVPGTRRGGPGDFVKQVAASDNVLVIPTR
ncbi:MAG: DsrE/DsrF/TusD sulfur relay family protein [Thermoanaerobaculia bacterium]